ncbi:helix-turn-helix transcriptional regulator [Thomasclavelia cocleata]|uniref:helix-turn-helix transcriptional regulator n=1 Tax=Thomasclavelia cocleata TaxID=69824 RepID=UPI00242F942F|nr:helix-turn-helix transcriptional regulator [Thomasclavelia cocleata]
MPSIEINTLKIKSKRVELNLRQVHMAKLINCSTTTYSKKECGKVDFNGKELLIVSQALHIPMEELYIFNNNLTQT